MMPNVRRRSTSLRWFLLTSKPLDRNFADEKKPGHFGPFDRR
jgi:hypothetical protein